uniref:Uncharacterized protein n=1 Tax=Kalanchoe fedtschenkoi TaxID=63787 RepID=A0A7N0USN6_KALFE
MDFWPYFFFRNIFALFLSGLIRWTDWIFSAFPRIEAQFLGWLKIIIVVGWGLVCMVRDLAADDLLDSYGLNLGRVMN